MSAEQLRTASAFGPNHTNAEGYAAFLAELDRLTNGKWTGEDFPSGLVAPTEMTSALQGGIIDVGSVLMPYFPAEFVESSLPAELAMAGSDVRAVSAAAAEYIVNCAECLAEFKAVNATYFGATATTGYNIMSTRPILTASDMNGVRIRIGGAAFSRWAEALGAVPVQIGGPEVFQSLSQGVIQAHYGAVSDMDAYNLYEIVTSITKTNFGQFNGISPFSMRLDLFQSLEPEDRKAMVSAAQYGVATIIYSFRDQGESALDKAREANIEVVEPSPELVAANEAFRAAEAESIAALLTSKGVTGAEEKVARYLELLDKWTGLVDEVETKEDYTALLMSEIWDKIDLTTFGN